MESRKKKVIATIHVENETCSETSELLEPQENTETSKITVLDDEFIHNVRLDTTVLDGLISKCYLTIEDREEIINQERTSERNRMILNILMARPYRTFQTFTEELIEFDQSSRDLVSKLKNYDCTGDISLPSLTTMDINNHTIHLQKNFKILVHQLATAESIVDHLISAEILCPEDQAEICAKITKEQKNRLLLTKLMYKDAAACSCFTSALKADTCYEELARRIERTDVTTADKIYLQIGRTAAKEKNESARGIRKCVETENVIPKNIQDQHNVLIEQWCAEDETFVSTRAADEVLKRIKNNISVIVSGNSGVGKTATMRHVALLLKKEGYRVIPTSNPEDLRSFSQKGMKTLFVIDDICGHFTLKEQKVDKWEEILAEIQPFFDQNPFKIIATCRLQVFKDPKFKALSLFSSSECNLNSETIKLTADEKSRLADMYFKEHAAEVKDLSNQFDFFPLLCKLYQKSNYTDINHFFKNPFEFYRKEIEDLQKITGEGGKLKYCCLVLCVIFNNRIDESMLKNKQTNDQSLIEDTLIECKLNKGTSIEYVKESFQTLEDTFLTKEDGTYRTIHDKLFDFLAQIIVRKNIDLCIRYCKNDFIRERFLCKPDFTSQQETNLEIILSNDHVDTYIERLTKDWSDGQIASVFGNINMKNPKFIDKLMKCLNKVDTSEQQALAHKQDIESDDSPLLLSCFIGNACLTEWVLENTKMSTKKKKHIHPKINSQRQNGATSLYIACENGHLQLVKLLLKYGPDTNLKNAVGKVPLHAACYNNHIEIVRLLLDNKSTSVNVLDNKNISPLYSTCQCSKGHFDVMELLLQNGADVKNGKPPLIMTCTNGNTKMSEILIEWKADVNACVTNGVSPLFMACQNRHYETVCLLLKSHADINLHRETGASPLVIASQNGDLKIVEKLLQYDCNINSGISPLYLASQNGHFDVVCKLIDAGANLNTSDSDGKTALFKACQNGHLEIVSKLLECKADANLCMKNNVTPMEIAEKNNHLEIVSVLKEHEQDEQTSLLVTSV